jgi:hypothetical protein
LVSACRMIGTIKPPSSATATPTSECLKRKMRSPAQAAFAAGTRCNASANARMMKSLSESLNSALPSRFVGAAALTCSRAAIIDRDVRGQIECGIVCLACCSRAAMVLRIPSRGTSS